MRGKYIRLDISKPTILFLLHLLLRSHMGNKRLFLDCKSVIHHDGSTLNPWICGEDQLSATCLHLSHANLSFGTRLERDITFQSALTAHDSEGLAELAGPKRRFMEKR